MRCATQKVFNTLLASNILYLASTSGERRQIYLGYAAQIINKEVEKGTMKYRHIVFDLDGTLLDTEAAVLNAWQHTLRGYRYHFPLEELRVVLGITVEKGIDALGVLVDNQFERRLTESYALYTGNTAFFPGVGELLLQLKQRGYSLGVVTSRNREECRRYFGTFGLEILCGQFICAEDTERHKPEPEPLLKYMEKAGAAAESCIYIGDMPTDVACANRAGAVSALAVWNQSGILCPDAQLILQTPADLLRILDARA